MAARVVKRQQPVHRTMPALALLVWVTLHQPAAECSLSGLKHCSRNANLLWLMQAEVTRATPALNSGAPANSALATRVPSQQGALLRRPAWRACALRRHLVRRARAAQLHSSHLLCRCCGWCQGTGVALPRCTLSGVIDVLHKRCAPPRPRTRRTPAR